MDYFSSLLEAQSMIHAHSLGSTRQLTLGADWGYVSADFVRDLRQACVTPNVSRKSRHSAIDGRTTRHDGYALSQKHPHVAPSLPPVVERLGRAIRPRRVTPSQPVAIEENYPTEHPPVIDPRPAMALGKERLQPPHLIE
jgi:hypothetical protein